MSQEQKATIGTLLADLEHQTTVLALTVGCALKEIAQADPATAQRIEASLRVIVDKRGDEFFSPRSQSLLDLMYSALRERNPENE